MVWYVILLLVVAAGVLVVIALLILGGIRLHSLNHRPGTFVCALRAMNEPDGMWRQGVAQYCSGHIEWWRSWSVSVKPARTFSRAGLVIASRTKAEGTVNADTYVVRIECNGEAYELALSGSAYAGLASWLEAAPPGRRPTAV